MSSIKTVSNEHNFNFESLKPYKQFACNSHLSKFYIIIILMEALFIFLFGSSQSFSPLCCRTVWPCIPHVAGMCILMQDVNKTGPATSGDNNPQGTFKDLMRTLGDLYS